ncbi:hypothetical protein SDJN02_05768, partial [Cucurbita argyrosperma subsp. argyrosperma]
MASRCRSLATPTISLIKSTLTKPSIKATPASFFTVRSSPTISRQATVSSARLTSCLGIDSVSSRSLSQVFTECIVHRTLGYARSINLYSVTSNCQSAPKCANLYRGLIACTLLQYQEELCSFKVLLMLKIRTRSHIKTVASAFQTGPGPGPETDKHRL